MYRAQWLMAFVFPFAILGCGTSEIEGWNIESLKPCKKSDCILPAEDGVAHDIRSLVDTTESSGFELHSLTGWLKAEQNDSTWNDWIHIDYVNWEGQYETPTQLALYRVLYASNDSALSVTYAGSTPSVNGGTEYENIDGGYSDPHGGTFEKRPDAWLVVAEEIEPDGKQGKMFDIFSVYYCISDGEMVDLAGAKVSRDFVEVHDHCP